MDDEIIIQQDIQVKQKPEKPKKIQLLSFDDQQIQIEQFDDGEQLQELQQFGKTGASQIRKRQIRTKVQQYIDYRRSLGLTSENRILGYREEEEEIDGALIEELVTIQGQLKVNSQIQAFVLSFNKNPQNAINEYVKKGIIKDDTPQSIASYLIKVQTINKELLGEYFGKNNPKALKILFAFCNCLNFKDLQFDKALRLLLSRFKLPKESQQIERIVWEFSQAYYEVNKHKYDNPDQLFPLSYAIIMLSTDAHNPNQQKKMTKQQFVKNSQPVCPSISKQYLQGIYQRITKQAFKIEGSYIQTHPIIAIPDVQALLKLAQQLKKGDVFLKICWGTKKYVQRKLYLSQDQERIQWVCDPQKNQKQIPRFINISDISDLTLGLGSQVMRKNNVPQQFDSLCFTITTPYRTLDLKAKSIKQRSKWIDYIRVVLIKRRERKAKQLEQSYKNNISFEQIQQIWNTEIFPKWDDHWDYKKKKPKQKSVIVRGFEALCGCFSKDQHSERNSQFENSNNGKRLMIKSSMLDTLWGFGLPSNSRKILWPLVIGNNLAITPLIIEEIKKRSREDPQIQKFTSFNQQVIQLAKLCRQFRPDIPPVRDLLLVSQIFWKVFPKNQSTNPINPLLNELHLDHFLSFYRADKIQIDLRIKLFDYLLEINAPKIRDHFKGLKLEISMFLVRWFLSIFHDCFNYNEQLLLRIWDNFLLEGQIYLFKVGITIIKYYEIQLNMCTFHEGLSLLRFPKDTSSVLFFKILQQEIKVKEEDFNDYIQKRKNAIIKTKVQAIPLQ